MLFIHFDEYRRLVFGMYIFKKFRFSLSILLTKSDVLVKNLNSIFMAFLLYFFCTFFLCWINHFAAPETLKDKLKIIIYQLRMTSYPVKEMQIQHCQFWGKKWCEGGEFKGLSLFRVVVTYIQSRRFDGIFGWQIVKST